MAPDGAIDWPAIVERLASVPPHRIVPVLRGAAVDASASQEAEVPVRDVWVLDHQHRTETSLVTGRRRPAPAGVPVGRDAGDVDRAADGGAAATEVAIRWLGRRLGHLELDPPGPHTPDGAAPLGADDARRLASLVGAALLAGVGASDDLAESRRSREMTLPAEIQWSLLPETDYRDARVAVSAAVEPAYETGGDVFDYAVSGSTVRLAVLDAMGHGLSAALCSALATGALRRARRSGAGLVDAAAEVHEAVRSRFGDSTFVAAVLAEVDLDAREVRWVNAGHLPPLLWNRGALVPMAEVEARSGPPVPALGMDLGRGHPGVVVHRAPLGPGDAFVVHTDGMVDNLVGDGQPWGVHRLRAYLSERLASAEPLGCAVDTVAQLMALGAGRLRDDATIVVAAPEA